jgi:hypothetical protein
MVSSDVTFSTAPEADGVQTTGALLQVIFAVAPFEMVTVSAPADACGFTLSGLAVEAGAQLF